jgi:MFS family permease
MATTLVAPVDTRRRAPLYTLFSANAISMIGNQITNLAIPWFVLTGGGSAVEVGLVGVFTFVPLVLATIFGGAVVDRLGHARTSVISDLLSAGAVALIPLLHLTVGLNLWALLALVFLGTLLDAPGQTARMSLLPDVADEAGMPPERANSAFQTVQRASTMIGPVLSGALIGFVGAANVLWIDAATFLVSAGLILRLAPRLQRPAATAATDGSPPPSGYLDDVRAGIAFVRRDSVLWRLIAVVSVLNLVEAPVWGIMLPVFAKDAYGQASALGLLFGSLGAGSVVGAVVYGAIGHRQPRWPIFVTGFLVIGLPMFGLATAPSLGLGMALMAMIGLASGPINPIIMTVAQERVPAEMRGRVFGALQALACVAIPMGLLGGGAMLELVGMRASLLSIATAYVAISLGMRFSRELRGIERKEA